MVFVIYHKLSNIPARWANTALSTLGGARVDTAKHPSLPTFFHTDLNLSLAIHHYPSCLNHKLLCSDINYFSSDKGSSALPHFLLRFIHIYISSFSWAILYICIPKAIFGLATDTVLWLVHSSSRGFQLTFRISQYIFFITFKVCLNLFCFLSFDALFSLSNSTPFFSSFKVVIISPWATYKIKLQLF